MDGPRTVEAVWGADYTVSFAAVGALVLAGLAVLWVRRSRR
jgi:LPXTG-motif cell wall-anchored protein